MDHDNRPETERLMTSAEVAALYRVDPKTVVRWVKEGKLTSVPTPGGHHRFRPADVRAQLNGQPS